MGAPNSRRCPVPGPQEPRDTSGDGFSKERGSEACLSPAHRLLVSDLGFRAHLPRQRPPDCLRLELWTGSMSRRAWQLRGPSSGHQVHPEPPPLGPESSRPQREPAGRLSDSSDLNVLACQDGPQTPPDPLGLGEDATVPCGPPRRPAGPGAGLCVSCCPLGPPPPHPSCSPEAAEPQTALLPWPLGRGPGRDGKTVRAHSQGKACPTCGRPGGQPRGPAPKQNPPAPWETQCYEAREAWGLLLGCGGQSLPPRTLDPGPCVDGSAAWMGGTGRLTWERWDEQVVSGTGGSQLSPVADPHCGTQEGAVSCPSAKPEAGPRERPPAGKEQGPGPPSWQGTDRRRQLR